MSRRRDRRQAGGRLDRPDRAGRPERTGRPGGADQPGGAGQPDRAGGPGGAGRTDRRGRPDGQDPRAGRRDRDVGAGILRDLAILVAAFAIGVGAAELFGAANLGVAFGVGQVVFVLTLIVLLTRE
jgi:hypothetical protein